MKEQIFYCKSRGVRVPVRLEVFKHGGSFYLAYVNHEENVHVPLIGSAAAWLAEFGRAQELIETASRERDQGHISRAGNGTKLTAPSLPTLADLNGDPRHDFTVFVRRFAKSSPDIVAAIAQVYKTKGYKVPGMEAILQGYDDLDSVWAIRLKIVNARGELVYGARNKIARALGIRDAGNYRGRVDTVIWLLKHAPEDGLEVSREKLEDLGQLVEVPARKSAVSNTQRTWKKAVNE